MPSDTSNPAVRRKLQQRVHPFQVTVAGRCRRKRATRPKQSKQKCLLMRCLAMLHGFPFKCPCHPAAVQYIPASRSTALLHHCWYSGDEWHWPSKKIGEWISLTGASALSRSPGTSSWTTSFSFCLGDVTSCCQRMRGARWVHLYAFSDPTGELQQMQTVQIDLSRMPRTPLHALSSYLAMKKGGCMPESKTQRFISYLASFNHHKLLSICLCLLNNQTCSHPYKLSLSTRMIRCSCLASLWQSSKFPRS